MIKPKNYYGYMYDLEANDVRLGEYTKQLEDEGFDDTETWSLYNTIAKFTLPRLIRFKEIGMGYPVSTGEETWESILNAMISAFTLLVEEDNLPSFTEKQEEEIKEGLRLFGEHFKDLWW